MSLFFSSRACVRLEPRARAKPTHPRSPQSRLSVVVVVVRCDTCVPCMNMKKFSKFASAKFSFQLRDFFFSFSSFEYKQRVNRHATSTQTHALIRAQPVCVVLSESPCRTRSAGLHDVRRGRGAGTAGRRHRGGVAVGGAFAGFVGCVYISSMNLHVSVLHLIYVYVYINTVGRLSLTQHV